MRATRCDARERYDARGVIHNSAVAACDGTGEERYYSTAALSMAGAPYCSRDSVYVARTSRRARKIYYATAAMRKWRGEHARRAIVLESAARARSRA